MEETNNIQTNEAPEAPEAMPANPPEAPEAIVPQENKGGVLAKKCAIWFRNPELKARFKTARKEMKMKAEPFLKLLLDEHAEIQETEAEFNYLPEAQ